MVVSAARELYGRAELRLRELLFGDNMYSGGGLRGEGPRQQASVQIRRMRAAFHEVADQAEQEAGQLDLADDLRDKARGASRDARVEHGEAEHTPRQETES